jgi:hypothetical protein
VTTRRSSTRGRRWCSWQKRGPSFQEELAAATIDKLARALPNATREAVVRAVWTDVGRHNSRPMCLVRAEPCGSA